VQVGGFVCYTVDGKGLVLASSSQSDVEAGDADAGGDGKNEVDEG